MKNKTYIKYIKIAGILLVLVALLGACLLTVGAAQDAPTDRAVYVKITPEAFGDENVTSLDDIGRVVVTWNESGSTDMEPTATIGAARIYSCTLPSDVSTITLMVMATDAPIYTAQTELPDKENLFVFDRVNGHAWEHYCETYENGFCVDCDAYERLIPNDGIYEIANEGQLYWFAALINGTLTDGTEQNTYANAVLMADITVNAALNRVRAWTPIGHAASPFHGTFDGNKKTIRGLYLDSDENDQGLFGFVGEDGTLKDLAVADSYIKGNTNVGGLVGTSMGTVENCCYIGTLVGTETVGGAVGYHAGGSVKNCYSTTTRVIGTTTGSVQNCYYLSDAEADEIDGTAAKNAAQLASGEVAWLLNGSTATPAEGERLIWGQTISAGDPDAFPVFHTAQGDTVYRSFDCDGESLLFSNDPQTDGTTLAHTFEAESHNGFCDVCGAYQPAPQSNGIYEISNAGQLYWFASLVNTSDASANAILTADITVNTDVLTKLEQAVVDVRGFRGWIPIGTDLIPFGGTFDGNGKTVNGLFFLERETPNVGLFGYVNENGTVKNVTVSDSYFHGASAVGGIVGRNHGTVQDCRIAGDVFGTDTVGGIVGYHAGTLTRCHSTGTVHGRETIGGVVGRNHAGNVTSCYNTSSIRATRTVGGIIGHNEGGIARNCYNLGEVSGTEAVGSAFGWNLGSIDNCYYLSDTESDTLEKTIAKTAEQFASGEVALLLGEDFGQSLGEEASPTLGGKKVYYGYFSCADDDGKHYTNEGTVSEARPAHTDANTDHVCDHACGKTDLNMDGHTDSAEDDDHLCDYGCGAVLESCSPNADDGDCTTDILCTVCGTVMVAGKDAHTYGAWQTHTAEQHKQTCACGTEIMAEHAWNGGEITLLPTCTAQGENTFLCTVCGETMRQAIPADANAHADADGNYKCDGCEMKLPHDGLPKGAIIGIAAGSTVAAAVVIFLILRFLIKKKMLLDRIKLFMVRNKKI